MWWNFVRYLPAWSNPISNTLNTATVPSPDATEGERLQDAGVRVRALSRWNNYYVAGLRQIQRDYDADGIYLDEIACVPELSVPMTSKPWRNVTLVLC